MSPGWTMKDWSGREDLNLRPPAPKDWLHEESTTCMDCVAEALELH